MRRRDLENELTRLRRATPTKIESFAARRSARIVELETVIAAMPEDPPPPNPELESLLRRSGGGDRFGAR